MYVTDGGIERVVRCCTSMSISSRCMEKMAQICQIFLQKRSKSFFSGQNLAKFLPPKKNTKTKDGIKIITKINKFHS
jgi:hypothetical protein